jgi:hypothetical protein
MTRRGYCGRGRYRHRLWLSLRGDRAPRAGRAHRPALSGSRRRQRQPWRHHRHGDARDRPRRRPRDPGACARRGHPSSLPQHPRCGPRLRDDRPCRRDHALRRFGGRPRRLPVRGGATGNICTEDLVYLLNESGYETGIDLDKLIEAARLDAGHHRPRFARTGDEGRAAAPPVRSAPDGDGGGMSDLPLAGRPGRRPHPHPLRPVLLDDPRRPRRRRDQDRVAQGRRSRPRTGATRSRACPGTSPGFNRNKRSFALDLKRGRGARRAGAAARGGRLPDRELPPRRAG